MAKFHSKAEYIDVLPPEPRSQGDVEKLCGWAGEEPTEAYWDAHGDEHAKFQIVGASEPPEKVQLWRIYRKVLNLEPDTTPQPTGNCVAAAADDVVELLSAIEIGLGDSEQWHPIYNPYHYATGRVLVGNNRLRGGAGSLGGWQAEAIRKYGVIRLDRPGLPKYNKRNCDAWGDDRDAEGIDFRDFIPEGQKTVVRSTARVRSLDDVIESLANLYPLTIAASFGYEMQARSPEGNMGQGRSAWSHQMSIWGYDLKNETIEIKNQWGDVHGRLVDPDDGTELPRGFIRTDFKTFEKHLRGSETIAFSNFQGFPAQKYDFGGWA